MKQNRYKLKDPAQITIVRRESSGLNSFTAWDIYLNGESVGKIKDGTSITARTEKRKNELTAVDSSGTVNSLFRFFVESGADSQVAFNGGKFQTPQGMNIVLPSDEPEGFAKIAALLKSKIGVLIYLPVLAGYYAGVCFLTRGDIVLAFALGILPVLIITLMARYANSEMIDYLYFNNTQALSRITRDQAGRLFMRHETLFFDREVVDQDYEELRRKYKRLLWGLFFCGLACIATFIFAGTASVHPPAEPTFTIPSYLINP